MNRTSHSRRVWAWGAAAGTLLAAGIGCTSSQSLVRNDVNGGMGVAHAADHANPSVIRAQSPEGTVISSSEGYTVEGYPPGYCPPGMEGYGHGGYGPMVNCNRYPGGIRYTHSYEDPGVPVYPPGTAPAMAGPGTPGAVVQYPYYTTKGPDDFFFDEDGRF